jgi:hypothetical protein
LTKPAISLIDADDECYGDFATVIDEKTRRMSLSSQSDLSRHLSELASEASDNDPTTDEHRYLYSPKNTFVGMCSLGIFSAKPVRIDSCVDDQ